jgi:hypothetical protein
MSRSYRVDLDAKVKDIEESGRVTDVIMEFDDELDVDSWPTSVQAYGVVSLGGGNDTDDWATEIAKKIWAVTKRHVEITVNWWYEDRSPDEVTYLDEDAYLATLPALTQLATAADEEGHALDH